MPAVTIAKLNNADLDCDHIADVATSLEDTATDRLGNTKLTVAGAVSTMGKEDPVVYASGLSMSRPTQTIVRTVVVDGDPVPIVYAPLPSALPFTTSGTWTGSDALKFRVTQGVTSDQLALPGAAAGIGHAYDKAPAYLHKVSEILNGGDVSVDWSMTQAEIDVVRSEDYADFDATARVNEMLDAMGVRGGRLNFNGRFKITRGIVVEAPITLVGQSRGSNGATHRHGIVAAGDFTAVSLADGAAWGGLRDIAIMRLSGTGDAVDITSGRVDIGRLAIVGAHRDGLVVRAANASLFAGIYVFGATRDGILIDGGTGADTNGMFMSGLDLLVNGRHALHIKSSFIGLFHHITSQGNGGASIYYDAASNVRCLGVYSENNTLGPIVHTENTNRCHTELLGFDEEYEGEVPDPNGTNTWTCPGDTRSTIATGNLKLDSALEIGPPGNGSPGFLRLKDTGTEYALTLEGTGGDATLELKSSGAGALVLDTKAVKIPASIAPTLLNSWTAVSGRKAPGYCKTAGIVYLEGSVKDGTVGGNEIFVLPVGYRPADVQTFMVYTLSGATRTAGFVIVDNSGRVYPDGGGNTAFSLDGISFRAA